MKHIFFVISFLLFTTLTFGQWTYKTINSEFDGTFKKAYTKTNGGGYLVMEVGEPIDNGTIKINRPFLVLMGTYFCDDYAFVDIVFFVNGINKKHELFGIKSRNGEMYYFDESIWTDEFINDFKGATKCSIRVNQDYCRNDYYQFNFSGSTAAYNFITK